MMIQPAGALGPTAYDFRLGRPSPSSNHRTARLGHGHVESFAKLEIDLFRDNPVTGPVEFSREYELRAGTSRGRQAGGNKLGKQAGRRPGEQDGGPGGKPAVLKRKGPRSGAKAPILRDGPCGRAHGRVEIVDGRRFVGCSAASAFPSTRNVVDARRFVCGPSRRLQPSPCKAGGRGGGATGVRGRPRPGVSGPGGPPSALPPFSALSGRPEDSGPSRTGAKMHRAAGVRQHRRERSRIA